MSNEELQRLKELVKAQHEQETALFNRKFWRGLLIAAIPIFLLAAIGSYVGVQTSQEVNRTRINNLESKTGNNRQRIIGLEEENVEQWKYIYDGKTRGHSLKNKDKDD
jgi:hypothetical protein